MDYKSAAILSITIFHLTILAGGILSIYLGYRLFILAAGAKASDGAFRFKDWAEIKLTKVAPGVFFALFGAAILIYSVSRPEQITYNGPVLNAASPAIVKASNTPTDSGGGGVVIKDGKSVSVAPPTENFAAHDEMDPNLKPPEVFHVEKPAPQKPIPQVSRGLLSQTPSR
jgi:hypothetical protein